MCVCACFCVCICVVCLRVHARVCVYLRACAACVCMCGHVPTCVHACVCMCVCLCVCACVCACVCVCVCVCVKPYLLSPDFIRDLLIDVGARVHHLCTCTRIGSKWAQCIVCVFCRIPRQYHCTHPGIGRNRDSNQGTSNHPGRRHKLGHFSCAFLCMCVCVCVSKVFQRARQSGRAGQCEKKIVKLKNGPML
jgi:hypothetical protein